MPKELNSIKNIIQNILANRGENAQNKIDKIVGVFEDFRIREVNIVDYQAKILTIEIESSIYKNEIQIKKNNIINAINKLHLEDISVSDIKILIKGRRY